MTVTAGDPPESDLSDFAAGLHQRWQRVSGAVAARRLEDELACNRLGADFLHWHFLDCIYRQNPRTGKPLYPSEEALFGPLHSGEATLVELLAQRISELPHWDQIVAPLTVGNHVDHQLTRCAVEHYLDSICPLYYEEYPYVQNGDILKWLSPPNQDWQPRIIPLSEDDIKAKIEAISCYRSQLGTFFKEQDDLIRQVTGYVSDIGGERLWYIAEQDDLSANSTQG